MASLFSLRAVVVDLPPAYFALVMATGVVSIAAYNLSQAWIGYALFYLNIVFYAALVVLHAARLITSPRRCLNDLHDPGAGPGYFTWIAGTTVLGTQCIVFEQAYQAAAALFVAGVILSAVVSYTVLTALALRPVKPTLESGINGGWLIPVVAMQSLVVLMSHLAGHWWAGQPVLLELHFAALALWLAGIMLYLWLGLLLFYRCFFFVLSPIHILPTFWISMGATAISTLAGSTLITAAERGIPFLHSLKPFLEGLTVLCWAAGTWWIPLLVIIGVWRHVVRGVRLTYDPLYWGLVFPLGMYAVATSYMSHSMQLPFLRPIPVIFCYVALLAWAVTLTGLVMRLASGLKRATSSIDTTRG